MSEQTNIRFMPGVSRPSDGRPDEALVKVLENLLSRAKSGQLQSLIATGFLGNGERVAAWGGQHENVYEMRGAIAWLENEYVDRVLDRVE